MAVGENPSWNAFTSTLPRVADEEGERLSPTSFETLWIPDEVTNTHRGEFLTLVPRS